MAKKIGLTILIGVIIVAILTLIVNLGVSIFYESPEYNDYCDRIACEPMGDKLCDQEQINWEECNSEYDSARDKYNQNIFYIFAGIGLILLLMGLFIEFPLIQITGLSTGGILVVEGLIRNFENKISVFIASIIVLVIFVGLAIKKLK